MEGLTRSRLSRELVRLFLSDGQKVTLLLAAAFIVSFSGAWAA
jgi:hypothetical protein